MRSILAVAKIKKKKRVKKSKMKSKMRKKKTKLTRMRFKKSFVKDPNLIIASISCPKSVSAST